MLFGQPRSAPGGAGLSLGRKRAGTLATTMLVATDELHVWRARLDAAGWPGAEGLPAGERERAEGLRDGHVRRRWLAARWALRGVLGRYLEREPAAIELTLGERGKPALAGPAAALRFNLSHSGELALIAVAREREVGADVEKIKPRRNLLGLARRALSAADAAGIEALPAAAQLAAFHAAWTRREAVAKCSGAGLGGPPSEEKIAVVAVDPGPGYAAAVAVAGGEVPERQYFDATHELLSAPS